MKSLDNLETYKSFQVFVKDIVLEELDDDIQCHTLEDWKDNFINADYYIWNEDLYRIYRHFSTWNSDITYDIDNALYDYIQHYDKATVGDMIAKLIDDGFYMFNMVNVLINDISESLLYASDTFYNNLDNTFDTENSEDMAELKVIIENIRKEIELIN